MRHLARSRNSDEIFGIVTNLYEWQILHYSRTTEISNEPNFFTASQLYPLYHKNKSYTYADLDMKLILALL